MERWLSSQCPKFHFLNDLEAAVGFTSTLMTQQYSGTTTIVPQVTIQDYFKLFSSPSADDMHRFFQAGRVAAYQHCAMMKLHYSIGQAFEECLAALEEDDSSMNKTRRSSFLLSRRIQEMDKLEAKQRMKHSVGSLTTVAFTDLSKTCVEHRKDEISVTSSSSGHDDEYEKGGFDGVDVPYARSKKKNR